MPPAQNPFRGARRSGGSGDLRQGNLTQILRFVRDHGPSSRHDIAHGCGLGISTMTDLVGELRSRRLVRELEPIRRAGAGRPTRPIALDGEPWCVLGTHLDLDQVEFTLATVGGRELWQDTVPIDLRQTGPSQALPALREMLRTQLSRVPVDKALVAVEVGVPGLVIGQHDLVRWSPDLGWRELPLRSLVSQALAELGVHTVHVGISNDSHLAALQAARVELTLPAGSVIAYFGGQRNLGSAIIIDGQIFRGASGAAGEFAHLNVDPSGPLDRCGRHGCLESLLGLRQLLTASELVPAADADRMVNEKPRHAVQVLADAAAAEDPAALAVLATAGAALGRAIDDVVAVLDPDAVILGGYLAVLSPYLLTSIRSSTSARMAIAAYTLASVVPLSTADRQVVTGATLAARDACLDDPLTWTRPLVA
jgi:predicted NBD/HSP70 family sugar kinase